MKKPMRNRIISSFTSAVLAMSYVIPDGLPRAGEMLSANAAVGPIISVGADDIGNSTNVNKMPVEFRFRTAWPKPEAMNNEHPLDPIEFNISPVSSSPFVAES